MTTPCLLDALREATRAQHHDIEALLRLTQPLERRRYAAIIGGFHAFLARWEPRIQDVLPRPLHPWWQARQRAPFAADDLRHLGAAPSIQTTQQASAAVAGLPLRTPAQAFGSMYVIEGSALGGQVITPRLQHTLGLRPGAGASYFHGFGPTTGAMWRDFRDTLQREVPSTAAAEDPTVETAVQQACHSARLTFGALITVFQGLPP